MIIKMREWEPSNGDGKEAPYQVGCFRILGQFKSGLIGLTGLTGKGREVVKQHDFHSQCLS